MLLLIGISISTGITSLTINTKSAEIIYDGTFYVVLKDMHNDKTYESTHEDGQSPEWNFKQTFSPSSTEYEYIQTVYEDKPFAIDPIVISCKFYPEDECGTYSYKCENDDGDILHTDVTYDECTSGSMIYTIGMIMAIIILLTI